MKIITYEEFIKSIKTPEELMNWMNKNIKYDFPDEKYIDDKNYPVKSGEELWKARKGYCAEQVNFEYDVLTKLGYTCHLIDCKEENKNETYYVGGQGHLFLVYEDGNEYAYFEHAWEGQEGIRKFKSMDKCLDYVASVWDRFDEKSTKLVFRKLKNPIHGVTIIGYGKKRYELPIMAKRDISKNKLNK